MKSFADNSGRTWAVTINVECIKRVRTLLGVNLLDAVEGQLIERLVTDPVLLCDCVYAVCKPEADARGITDEDFGRAMAGDVIEHACTALLEELVDFFPQAKRQVLAKALARLRQLEAKAIHLATARLDDPQWEETLRATLAESELPPRTPGDSSGNWPESSASSPAN